MNTMISKILFEGIPGSKIKQKPVSILFYLYLIQRSNHIFYLLFESNLEILKSSCLITLKINRILIYILISCQKVGFGC